MNPFDLSGPAFLLFYCALCVAVMLGLRGGIALAESGARLRLPLDDPYQIAWLRGGADEAVRLAILSLADRRMVELGSDYLRRSPGSAATLPSHPLERAIFDLAGQPAGIAVVFSHPSVAAACEQCRRQLALAGLVPNGKMLLQRVLLYGFAVAIVLGIAGLKAMNALQHGKSNLAFLALLAGFSPFALWWPTRLRRTHIGDRAVADLRRLFSALKARAASIRHGRMTSDAMLLAAVFGLNALPDSDFRPLKRFFRWRPSTAAGGGSDGGSNCGSSSGGCGGGGGGCGGCGS